ncbi:hypothetical protein [Hymenobacter sp. PAMC 26628]|uniref:glycosyl-4,4'-diaponeurosporenoate acyltransferase CrtO family protein n=1 Tax=Hymenobacter sp. PAMC 26628 TaxID=1484118 RepID=UPI00076FF475|nr:hypothetical protein [Hymenobacter sp. PAMC 26628]AMJ67874.1 hypothetical protein AXW84_22470 [Hymenobacter sp. PAMC 26628]
MPPAGTNAAEPPPPALLALANAVPNVFWSVLGLGPIGVYCYQWVTRPWLYGLLAASLLAYAVPAAWLGRWQLSRTPGPYRRLGVAAANRVMQHGDFVNRLTRRRYPRYRRVVARGAVAGLVRTTYQQERFHLALFLFFLAIGAYAAVHGQVGWAGLLALTNVGYNLYQMRLQQYIRVRLAAGAPRLGPQ